MRIFNKQFNSDNDVEAIFCKLLTQNDDSGKHGIVVPKEAYKIFPKLKVKISGDSIEKKCEFTTWILNKPSQKNIKLRYKYYHQISHTSSERRLTNFRSKDLDKSLPGEIFILTKKKKSYQTFFVTRKNKFYRDILIELGLVQSPPGAFLLDLSFNKTTSFKISPELRDLLVQFDKYSGEYCKTVKNSPQGVGITYENLLGIKQNNSPLADFKGIEIKCYKLKGNSQPYDQDLFLKEPLWVNSISGKIVNNREIIQKYGYTDSFSRKALKVRLSHTPNAQNLYISIDKKRAMINIYFKSKVIGYWDYKVIQERLNEKHKHAAFIGAHSIGKNENEQFNYKKLTYCSDPTSYSLVRLLMLNIVKIELRMHIDENNRIRNHGTQFRIKDGHLEDLYNIHQNLR